MASLAQLTLAQAAEDGIVSGRTQLIAVIVTVVLLGLVLELVRRRRLVERYALLWMLGGVAMVGLAIWRQGLEWLADLAGISSPPNALFLIALGVVFGLLLHFSVAISRLGEEAKILAQETARLDQEVRALRANGHVPAPEGEAESEPATERHRG